MFGFISGLSPGRCWWNHSYQGLLALESPLASVSHKTSHHSFSNLFPIYPVLSIHPLWPGSKRQFLRIFSILVKALWGALSQLCMQDPALTLWALGPSFISDHTVLSIHLFFVSVSSGDRTHPSVVHLVSLFSVMQDYSLIARLPYRKGQHNPPPGCGCGLMLHQHCEHSIVLVWAQHEATLLFPVLVRPGSWGLCFAPLSDPEADILNIYFWVLATSLRMGENLENR